MEIKNASHLLIVDNADLTGSTFHNVKLAAAAFRSCNLTNANYDDINFAGAKFSNINLTGVEISDCNITGMTIDGISVAAALDAYRKHPPQAAATAITIAEGGDVIRPFQESDGPQVVALWNAVFNYSAPHNNPATVIRQKLAVDRELFLVATTGEKIIATAMAGYDGHRGWIYSVAVDLSHRRQGIASRLTGRLERLLAERGCLKINLQVLASNAATVAFYEKLGYRVEERLSMGKLLT